MEAVSQARLRLLTGRRNRKPHRAIEHDALERRLRRETTERWRSWQLLPRGRRVAVQLTALALIAAAFMLASRLGSEDLPVTEAAPEVTDPAEPRR